MKSVRFASFAPLASCVLSFLAGAAWAEPRLFSTEPLHPCPGARPDVTVAGPRLGDELAKLAATLSTSEQGPPTRCPSGGFTVWKLEDGKVVQIAAGDESVPCGSEGEAE